MSVNDWLVAAGVTCLGVYLGFIKEPGLLLSWPMFANVSFYRVQLVDADGEPVLIWDYMIQGDYGGGPREVDEFVNYMLEMHGIRVVGEGEVRSPQKLWRLTVTGDQRVIIE